MISFTKIANERMDNMRAVLGEEHKTISAVVAGVRDLAESSFLEYNAVAYALSEVALSNSTTAYKRWKRLLRI